MRIQKTSDQDKISFVSKEETAKVSSTKSPSTTEVDNIKPIPTKKLNNASVIDVRGSSGILSAGGGRVKDEGGSGNFMGSKTNNSIWDTDIIDKIRGTETNKEKTLASKEKQDNFRKNQREENLNRLSEHLNDTDTRKESTIKAMTVEGSSSYQKPSSNLSIFDVDLFDNMPKETKGEKMASEVRASREKEREIPTNNGTKRLSSTIDSLFENLK